MSRHVMGASEHQVDTLPATAAFTGAPSRPEHAEAVKVFVLGDEETVALDRGFPDGLVGGSGQPNLPNVERARVRFGQQRAKAG